MTQRWYREKMRYHRDESDIFDYRIRPQSILLMPSRRDLREDASIGFVRPKARIRSRQAPTSAVLARAILKNLRRSGWDSLALPSAILRVMVQTLMIMFWQEACCEH